MLKTPFLQNKQTVIGLALMIGVVVLFLINVAVVVPTLVSVYGKKPSLPSRATIDATVFSEALKLINQ